MTVLLGPNDSGKSTILRAIVRDLAGGHFGADAERNTLIGGVFYVEVSDEDLNAVIREGSQWRRRGGHGEVRSAQRPPWESGLWSVKDEDDLTRERLLDLLGQRATNDTAVRDRIVARLSTSRILAIECAGRNDGGLRVWNAYWCLPNLDELDHDDSAAVNASDVQPYKRRREKEAGGLSAIGVGTYRVFHGTPSHLYVPGAPVAIASLGALSSVGMPSGLVAPADFAELRDAVSTSSTAMINMMVRGIDDASRDDEFDAQEEAGRAAPRAWLNERDGWVGLSDEAIAAADFVSRAATRLLPSFLADRYRIEVVIADVDEWFAADPLRVMMRPPSPVGLIEDFPIEDVADGYRVWVQLALLNALEDASRVTRLLGEVAGDVYDQHIEASHAYQEGRGEDGDAANEAARDSERRFDAVVNELKALEASTGDGWVSGDLEHALQDVPGDDWTRRGSRDRRLLVVDEPERHLQPRLQREAAKWLGELAARRHAPLLVATHSSAFLTLPGDSATYVSVHRSAEVLRVGSFDPRWFVPRRGRRSRVGR
ncbi:AAA family ATPase [Paraconexibacter antarcticus]|uniref:AAA family ATPase n=1 Tax=Paraconexibacter antarcticus TaxID=2949664 RepID=A0ABY5DXB0_9ACTN|nr:AAA family ATPase [Paraconexibacter antarcticus]UTI66145.1 AAA family ATPase [Paraconexibacter antarcticus]